MLSGAEVIARGLAAAGCRYAFAVPGGEVLALLAALEGSGIKVILAKHQNCAGFMGEGVHHFDGRPAILVATIGPGIANAVNVIANAAQDRVPLIALTGCVPAAEQPRYTHQVLDHVQLAESVCKAAFRVADGAVEVAVDKALRICLQGRPGPVLLDVPIDVQSAPQTVGAAHADRPGAARAEGGDPLPWFAPCAGRCPATRFSPPTAVRTGSC